MKTWITVALLLAASQAQACFLKSDHVSGMNKICIYRCIDGDKAITISSTSLCPLSI